MEWISVEDKLPDHGQKVICFGRQWDVNFAVFQVGWGGEPEFTNVKPGCFDNPGVTYWMPLPDPPTSA